MRLISKNKLISVVIKECKELRKCVDYLYSGEMDKVISLRIDKVYNLNYSMDYETQLFLFDCIIHFVYHEEEIKEFKEKLKELIK